MSKPIECTSCQQEIPVGKYYELWEKKTNSKVGEYCPLCWKKVSAKYEPLIERGEYKLAERERERETKMTNRNFSNLLRI